MGVFQHLTSSSRSWRERFGSPKNKRELFLCVLWDQFFSLFPINLVYMIFWLPTILWTVVHGLYLLELLEAGAVMEAVSAGNAWALGLIPCLTLTGPARAGMALTMRNWAAEEYVPALTTFWRGIRKNWKQAITVSFLTSLIPAVLWYNGVILLQSSGTPVLFALLCVAFGLFLLSQQVLFPLIVSYDLPLRGLIRNGLLLTVMKLPQFFLVRLATWFFMLLYAGFTIVRPQMRYTLLIIPVLYYFSVGAAVTELAYASYGNRLFEAYFSKA